jgi:hypothetical protein
MIIELRWPENLKFLEKEHSDFQFFLQLMTNRRSQGGIRYGEINRKQKYLTRMTKELKAYRDSGNAEQLLNIAVYAFLEWHAPENKKYHFDNNSKSVTRKGE